LRSGGEIQLSLDSLAMRFDRLDAQMQQLRSLAGAGAFADQMQYLQLAVREPLDRIGGTRGLSGGKPGATTPGTDPWAPVS
jgi:hypothetical protein